MSTQLTPEQRKQRTELIVKVAGLLGVCIVLAPLATTIAAGLGALAALGAGAAAVFTVWKFLPWFAMKIGNAQLKAIKAEAMKNPCETLQNEYIKKEHALQDYKTNIARFAAQVMAFADQVRGYVKDGLEDAQTYVEQLGKMKQLLELRKQERQDAQDMLAQFSETISRTEKKWKMACAAMAMNEAAGEMAGDAFDKICIETALDSVQTKLNESFAELDIALMDDEKEKRQLAAKQAKTLPPVSIVADMSAEPNRVNRQKIAE